LKNILKELTTVQLENFQRLAFYPLGAGKALLPDRANPKWKERYFADKFFVDNYLNAVR